MATIPGAMKVGPNFNDGSWWSSTYMDLFDRACHFDDSISISANGFYYHYFDGSTFIENWQDGLGDRCDAPCWSFSSSRDIETNTIQKEIEKIIKNNIEGYGYGTRRENQNDEINKSGLFGDVTYIEGKVTHSKSIEGQIEAWKSHATLERQAGSRFYKIIDEIEQYLRSLGEEFIDIDYTTRLWMAKAINWYSIFWISFLRLKQLKIYMVNYNVVMSSPFLFLQ